MNGKILIGLLGFSLLFAQLYSLVRSQYKFEKTYLQLWSLSDKSSTITAKQKYIGEFVAALEQGFKNNEFSEYNALFLKTPNNSFIKNLEALKTLSDRLNEIKGMNPNSFEYNTAIQQITAQEQGEAQSMIYTFSRCYTLSNYPIIWSWIGGLLCIIGCILGAFLPYSIIEHFS